MEIGIKLLNDNKTQLIHIGINYKGDERLEKLNEFLVELRKQKDILEKQIESTNKIIFKEIMGMVKHD